MHPHRKPSSPSGQPALRTIEVTDAELIIIQAALPRYLDLLRTTHPDLYQQASTHIWHLVQRLHAQLPPGKERLEDR